MNVASPYLSSYQAAVSVELPYQGSRRKQRFRDRVVAVVYDRMANPAFNAQRGLTLHAWLDQEVRRELGVGWLAVLLRLTPIIAAVIQLLLSFWTAHPAALEAMRSTNR